MSDPVSDPVLEPRPRIVDAAFWLWLAASVALMVLGMMLTLTRAPLPLFYRGTGVLLAVAGLALGYLAGRVRRGDARYRRAAVGLAIALTFVLTVFTLMTRGAVWLVPLILTMVGAVLVLRPSAQPWFDTAGEP